MKVRNCAQQIEHADMALLEPDLAVAGQRSLNLGGILAGETDVVLGNLGQTGDGLLSGGEGLHHLRNFYSVDGATALALEAGAVVTGFERTFPRPLPKLQRSVPRGHFKARVCQHPLQRDVERRLAGEVQVRRAEMEIGPLQLAVAAQRLHQVALHGGGETDLAGAGGRTHQVAEVLLAKSGGDFGGRQDDRQRALRRQRVRARGTRAAIKVQPRGLPPEQARAECHAAALSRAEIAERQLDILDRKIGVVNGSRTHQEAVDGQGASRAPAAAT